MELFFYRLSGYKKIYVNLKIQGKSSNCLAPRKECSNNRFTIFNFFIKDHNKRNISSVSCRGKDRVTEV